VILALATILHQCSTSVAAQGERHQAPKTSAMEREFFAKYSVIKLTSPLGAFWQKLVQVRLGRSKL
jgi:hypothetical protein